MSNKLSQQDFINRCQSVHGDKYDYENSVYAGANTPIPIFCKECKKVFYKSPSNHYKGQGCPNCAFRKLGREINVTTGRFIERAISVHGDKYDYSDAIYKTANDKITVTCPEHGQFSQVAYHHLAGHGCPFCHPGVHVMTPGRYKALENARRAKVGNKVYNKHTTEDFIRYAKLVHGDRYDYSKTKYITAKHKVIIVCPDHGEFEQDPGSHKTGVGCPKCSQSKGEKAIADYLTSVGIQYEQEKSFPECKDKGLLRFDFYFEHQGVHFLVEYQGIHHHKPIPFFERGGRVSHKWYVEHDKIKRAFAKQYGFIMIEVWYTVSDISAYLSTEISAHAPLPSECNYSLQLKLFD